ncbi:protein ANKUB1-like [Betta splendens]|uniref:Protein ANKUB1-like n=1 Tax=Betta splendens TaxID=158456 RepID=A0A9W2XSI1_BETSP|nr:protein ANKUB1-like [Betta splendens]
MKLFLTSSCSDVFLFNTGMTLRLDSWDGWRAFLHGCLLGCRITVQSHLSEEKTVMQFQLRVALYTAASLGHLKLADWLMGRGVQADEPVGVHPYRQWCHQTAHRDTGKCPIHVAAESGQLLILKLFVTNNVSTLACQDPEGREPLKIAIQHGHRDCVRNLANKLCSVVSPLPMRIYLQMKRWGSVGKKRVALGQWQGWSAVLQARLLLVDGFGQSKMSTKPIKAETQHRGGIRVKAQHLLTANLPKLSLQRGNDFREIQRRHNNVIKHHRARMDEIKGGDKNKLILPPVSRDTYSTESYNTASGESSLCFGQATRQNAVYCLNVARTFTGKPWSKQLGIARTLIRKRLRSMA